MEKWISSGGVVFDSLENQNVCIILPSNNYGPWTLPKGTVDKGESLEEAALREIKEETGIIAKIISGGYLGTGVGEYSITHYYVMEKISDTGSHDFETQEVKFVHIDEALKILTNKRDLLILEKAKKFLEAKKVTTESFDKSNIQNLNEVKLGLMGKIFFATCAAWLVGKLTKTKIKGTPQEINALKSAMLNSKRFQDELKKPGATVESVIQKLKLKNASAAEFKRILGIPWPL